MAAVRPDCLARQEWERKLLERGSLIRVVIGLHGLMTTPAPPMQSMRLLGDYITWEAVGRAPAMIHLRGNEEFQQHVRDVVARLDALGIHLENLPPKCALLTVLRLCDDRETSRRVKAIMRKHGQGYDTTVGAAATAGAVPPPCAQECGAGSCPSQTLLPAQVEVGTTTVWLLFDEAHFGALENGVDASSPFYDPVSPCPGGCSTALPLTPVVEVQEVDWLVQEGGEV